MELSKNKNKNPTSQNIIKPYYNLTCFSYNALVFQVAERTSKCSRELSALGPQHKGMGKAHSGGGCLSCCFVKGNRKKQQNRSLEKPKSKQELERDPVKRK